MVESSNGKKSNISLKRDVVLCKSVEFFSTSVVTVFVFSIIHTQFGSVCRSFSIRHVVYIRFGFFFQIYSVTRNLLIIFFSFPCFIFSIIIHARKNVSAVFAGGQIFCVCVT